MGKTSSRVVASVLVLLAPGATWRAMGAAGLARALDAPTQRTRAAALEGVVVRHPYLAVAHLERARALEPANPIETDRQRLERAQAAVEGAIRLRPAWGEAWAEAGRIRWLLGDRPGADLALRTAAQLDPTNARILDTRARYQTLTHGAPSWLPER
jgi:cytochrome c-type biogenesis protein CcmH/NrfG